MTPTSSASTYNAAASTGMFTGALMALGRLELLMVIVPPALLADQRECQLSVAAYQARFQKPVVLMAQDLRGAPRYYGPTRLMPVLAAMPFELIPWRQFLYRAPTPWRLPIPPDPPASPSIPSAAFVLPPSIPTPASTRAGRAPAKHRETLVAPVVFAGGTGRERAERVDDHASPGYRIDPDDAAGGARISQGTPPDGVAIPREDVGLDTEETDPSESRTVPIETVDLVEVGRWS